LIWLRRCRHAFEALRRGAHVVALDTDRGELRQVWHVRRDAGGWRGAGRRGGRAVAGDATAMPFGDGCFDPGG
jgi:hypothetical protein